MKKYILFTLKALLVAFTAWFAVKVAVVDSAERYYAKHQGSVLVPLWTSVAPFSESWLQNVSSDNLTKATPVILRQEEFERTFVNSKSVWVKFAENGSRFDYYGTSGTQMFFVADTTINTKHPNGTNIASATLMPNGHMVRLNLEPEWTTMIALRACGWMVLVVFLSVCAIAIIRLVKDQIMLAVGHWRYQRKKVKLGGTVSV